MSTSTRHRARRGLFAGLLATIVSAALAIAVTVDGSGGTSGTTATTALIRGVSFREGEGHRFHGDGGDHDGDHGHH